MKKLILGLIVMAAVLAVYRITYYKKQQKSLENSYHSDTESNHNKKKHSDV